jgi:hypothetical protein
MMEDVMILNIDYKDLANEDLLLLIVNDILNEDQLMILELLMV